MYSLVLMAAMTASPATPACHWGKGGGWGGCSGGCYGGYGGCYGGYGGGYGGGCYGYGGYAPLGCYGCTGCWGYGTFGLPSSYPGAFGYSDGGYSGSPYGPVHAPAPGSGAGPIKPEPVPPPKVEPGAKSSLNGPAKLIVELPGDAKLYIDDSPMKTTSGKRVFRTPTLERGQAYYYILRAEIQRDGKTETATKRVIVRAGEEVMASFSELRNTGEATAHAGR